MSDMICVFVMQNLRWQDGCRRPRNGPGSQWYLPVRRLRWEGCVAEWQAKQNGATTENTSNTGAGVGHIVSRAVRSADEEGSAGSVFESHTADHLTQLQARLLPKGLKTVWVRDDRNCQFRALAHQLGEDGKTGHREVRLKVAEFLEEHVQTIMGGSELWMFKSDEYENARTFIRRYARAMKVHTGSTTLYGDHVTLLAAAAVYKRSIRVVCSAGAEDAEDTVVKPPPELNVTMSGDEMVIGLLQDGKCAQVTDQRADVSTNLWHYVATSPIAMEESADGRQPSFMPPSFMPDLNPDGQWRRMMECETPSGIRVLHAAESARANLEKLTTQMPTKLEMQGLQQLRNAQLRRDITAFEMAQAVLESTGYQPLKTYMSDDVANDTVPRRHRDHPQCSPQYFKTLYSDEWGTPDPVRLEAHTGFLAAFDTHAAESAAGFPYKEWIMKPEAIALVKPGDETFFALGPKGFVTCYCRGNNRKAIRLMPKEALYDAAASLDVMDFCHGACFMMRRPQRLMRGVDSAYDQIMRNLVQSFKCGEIAGWETALPDAHKECCGSPLQMDELPCSAAMPDLHKTIMDAFVTPLNSNDDETLSILKAMNRNPNRNPNPKPNTNPDRNRNPSPTERHPYS
jgi:hypothetical protein